MAIVKRQIWSVSSVCTVLGSNIQKNRAELQEAMRAPILTGEQCYVHQSRPTVVLVKINEAGMAPNLWRDQPAEYLCVYEVTVRQDGGKKKDSVKRRKLQVNGGGGLKILE
ncbi:hypothetical protein CDAR_584671 [Caerostris darwini]|uniref:Uncharacterized protein n=1 Tax=Caerostris darwini TaxID=1538125 RepID=A0AAV4PZD1_9ARAC|nr:hypothetical protein CDAR_584671 [Caerostris darwini]